MSPTFLIILALILSISHSSSSSSQPSISIFPKTLSKSSNRIQIHYSNVDSPSPFDWLGIYSPPSSPHPNFIGYFLLSSVSSTWQSGSANFSFPLVNLRSPYQFRLFRWNESEAKDSPFDLDHNPLPGTKHLLAESEVVRFESGHGPDQVHLSFTDRDDEMRVMFVTDDGNVCFLKWGLGEGNLDNVAKTTLERYEREDMCDFPANSSIGWRDPGYVHSGIMSNLKKGKRYYYKVGSDSGGWSNIYSFISRNEDSDEAIAFLFGDMGTATPYSTFLRTQDESISTIKWILRDIEALGDKPSFISHIGDISYARGFSWLWDNFFDQIEPVASKVPYHVCIGNHEYDWPLQPWKPDWSSKLYGTDGGGECGVPYSIKFSMPGNFSEPTGTRAPATRNLFYSFDMGAVHFLYISTETNFLKGSSQYNFIKYDLESVNRRRTPFVVVQGHRPMYTTSNEITDTPIRRKMMEHLEPLFVRNRVTLALWGHVHRYERFCPMKNFTCRGMSLDGESDSKGFTTHIVIGMAGQDYQPIWHPRQDHPTDPIYPQPQQSLYRGGEFGYTRLFATREKLTLSYVGNHDGEVHDSVEFLASGQVVSSDGINDIAGNKVESAVESTLSRYVKVASLLVLGVFAGYVLGYLSHARQKNASQQRWAPVKAEEI